MTKLIVWKNGIKVGTAYSISHWGFEYEPTLIGNDGGELPPDWYTLQFEESFLIVLNDKVH